MSYEEAIDRVISAAIYWYSTDTRQRQLRQALDTVIPRADVAERAHRKALIEAWLQPAAGPEGIQ
jgi:hypothetical protein